MLTVTDGWVDGWTHHESPNYAWGMAVPSGVMGVIYHTMVGNLDGADEEFMNPGAELSAHFGIDQNGFAIQWVPINGGVAWAEMGGNYNWYSVEMADNGDPSNPYTEAQMNTAAQLAHLLSVYGNFPLVVTNSPSNEGVGTHCMGGAAWGGHSCPQNTNGTGPRSGQRSTIISLAKGNPTPPPSNGAWHVTSPPPGQFKGKVTLTAHGSDGKSVWYTSTVTGKSWTVPSTTESAITGTAEFYIAALPPGWWTGTGVLGGTGTDGNRWHDSTKNGSTWAGPTKS